MDENQLIQKCKELNELQVESALFHELNSLNKEKLSELEDRFYHQNVFKPVNFLRFLVAKLLSQGEEFKREKLEDLKSAIQGRNILEFYPEASQELLVSLREYKISEKGMFPQWKEPFPILYQFFYTTQEKIEVIQSIKNYGNEVIRTFNLENAQIHAVGFDGPQNYGSDEVWGAIIPANTQDVQHSFQLFFRFSERGVNGGLYRGHKVVNRQHKVDKI